PPPRREHLTLANRTHLERRHINAVIGRWSRTTVPLVSGASTGLAALASVRLRVGRNGPRWRVRPRGGSGRRVQFGDPLTRREHHRAGRFWSEFDRSSRKRGRQRAAQRGIDDGAK